MLKASFPSWLLVSGVTNVIVVKIAVVLQTRRLGLSILNITNINKHSF